MDVLDLLIETLREHEKALDFKIDALDGVIADLKQQVQEREKTSKLRKTIHEILDEYTPFDNWKNTSRALNEIKDLVCWLPPDERSQKPASKQGDEK